MTLTVSSKRTSAQPQRKLTKSALYQFADGSNLQMQRMTAKRAAPAASGPVDEWHLWVAPALQAFSVDICGHFCQYCRLSGLFMFWHCLHWPSLSSLQAATAGQWMNSASEVPIGLSTSARKEDPILLHPALAQVYGTKIAALADSLNDEASKHEAIELLRGLVSEVRLHPDENAPGGHHIELFGELAAILELSRPRTNEARRFTGGLSVSLVAGVGFEPTTFRL